MNLVLGFAHHTAIRLAEVGFLLIVIAGIWLAVAHVRPLGRWATLRGTVAGVVLAVGGVLLIIATHWGHFD